MSNSMPSMQILHVDDDPDFSELTADFLERVDEDYDIVTATDVEEGLERLGEGEFDCILSDYDMTGQNGLEFLETVRETHPDIPFILFTGKGSEEVASEAISAGVTDYLQKQPGTDQFTLLANRMKNTIQQYRSGQRAAALDRLRTLTADVNQALIRASSREEIETRVCEIFSSAAPYRFAWIGTVDEVSNQIDVRASAGLDIEGPFTATVTEAGDGAEARPVSRAARDREIAVSRAGATAVELELSEDAVDGLGIEAIAAVPFDFQDHDYGVLSVWADQPNAFDETEVELLEELGGDISHAIHAIETSERLREERDRRSALFENNPSPIVDFEYREATPVITAVNSAFEEVFEYDPETIIGQPIGDALVPPEGQSIHADISRQVYEGEPVETEVTRQTATGSRDFLLRVFPYDVNEHSHGGYAWYTDISDRVEREERLAHEQSLLEAVMETSIDGILVIDEDREYVAWNQQFLDLWDVPEELIGTEPEELGLEFALAQLEQPDEFIEQVEYLYEHPSEESRDQINLIDGRVFDRYSAPVEGRDGEYFGRVWFFRDVTNRIEAVEELQDRNTQLEEFASILSHDLRNPLNVAQGRLELHEAEPDEEHLESIGKALTRMEVLIDDLLTLAREGSALESTEPVALAELVETCWQTVSTGDAQLAVETDATIRADESRVRQLLENLIRNSVEHGGASVKMTVGDLDDGSGFFVEDTGPGIPVEDRERVLESGYSKSESGTGFGLAIVDRIAQAHSWTLTVTEGEAGGARFEFGYVDRVE